VKPIWYLISFVVAAIMIVVIASLVMSQSETAIDSVRGFI